MRMWKRLVICLGVCTYLFVLMLTRGSSEEGARQPHQDLLPPEDTTRYHTDLKARGPHHIKSLKSPTIIKDQRTRLSNMEGVASDSEERVLERGAGGGADNGIGFTNGIGNRLRLLADEPDGFISQNNSLKPLFASSRHPAPRPLIGNTFLKDAIHIRGRHLSEKVAIDSQDSQAMDYGERHRIAMRDSVQVQRDRTSNETKDYSSGVLEQQEVKPDRPCDINWIKKRNSRVCKVYGRTAECQARPIICQPQLCHFDEDSAGSQPFLLVIIHSHPSHRYRRNAIRDTWGSIVKDYTLQQRVVFLFILGSSKSQIESQAIVREVSIYRDIVQYELMDNYNNLTVKSVLALDWINFFCSNATYILKTDDDAFMNISNILGFLRTQPKVGVLIGSMHPNSEVQRNGQWKVEKTVYPASTYPPYCSGTAYVMTSDVAYALYRAHYESHTRDVILVPMEDVYITGILGKAAGISCNNSKPFPNWTTGPSPKSVESYLKGEVFGIHGLSHSGMYGLYKLVKQCGSCWSNSATLRKWFALLTGAT